MRNLLPAILLMSGLCGVSRGSAVTVNWFNAEGTRLEDFAGTPLVASQFGGPLGDVVQLGYYSLATMANPFEGTWVRLANGTIGDKADVPLGAGRYSYSASFPEASLLLGVPLSIRFYDSNPVQNATFYNAVSDSTGAWNTSSAPMTLSLSDSTLVWQDGASSAFRTTINIPEPSGVILVGLGLWLGLSRRRRFEFSKSE